MQSPSILYTFRRCPYAIRARMALCYAGVRVEMREVLLKHKPPEMLEASPKGTVPVLLLPNGDVLEESLHIIHWALAQRDPENWGSPPATATAEAWISANDGAFKHWLDRYKYADRHPEHPAAWYRSQALTQLERLEDALRQHPWLHGAQMGLVDVALFPFLRQFAMVDQDWFKASPFPSLRRWLENWLVHPRFLSVMEKLPRWEPGAAPRFLTTT